MRITSLVMGVSQKYVLYSRATSRIPNYQQWLRSSTATRYRQGRAESEVDDAVEY